MSAVHAYRLTKYDPALRDGHGHFTGEEWTSFAQVGKTIAGAELTIEDYGRVETAMVDGVLALLAEAGVRSLAATDLEPAVEDGAVAPFAERTEFDVAALAPVVRGALREQYWCRLRRDDAYVHFGWDYYVYVGLPRPADAARARIAASGLFLEQCASPYLVLPDHSVPD